MTAAHVPCAPRARRRCQAWLSGAAASLLSTASHAAQEEELSAWDLRWNLYRSGAVEILAPAGELSKRLGWRAQRLSRESGLQWSVKGPDDEADRHAARVLVGTHGDAWIEALVRRLDLRLLAERGFSLLGHEFRHPKDALFATLGDPRRPGLPVQLVFGNTLEGLTSYAGFLGTSWEPRLVVYQEGTLALEVSLQADGTLVEAEKVDYLARLDALSERRVSIELPGLHVYAYDDHPATRVRGYVASAIAARVRARSFFPEAQAPSVQVYLHAHPEDMLALTGRVDLARVNPIRSSVDVLLARSLPDDAGAGVVRAALLAQAGAPAHDWLLDGAALAAAERWWGRALEDWIAWLASGDLLPPLAQVMDPSAGARWSEHQLQPARALAFRLFLGMRGPEGVLAAWRGRTKLGPDADLKRVYNETVLAAKKGAGKRLRSEAARRRAALASAPPRAGVALVDDVGARGEAYARRVLPESLALAARSGADAASFFVWAALDPDPAGALPGLPTRAVHGSSSDATLFAALGAARARKLRTLLDVAPLAAPTGTFGDGVVLASAAEVERFFAEYERILVHYALLAELGQCELFNLGTELGTASRSAPLEEQSPESRLRAVKLLLWEDLIAKVRQAFGGGLVYTASPAGEIDAVGFLGELDFVGLTGFPRLAGPDEATPSDEALQVAWARHLTRAREVGARAGCPVILTQIGFPSAAGALANPLRPGRTADPLAQERAYRALARALDESRAAEAPLAGLFVWCWSPDPTAGGPLDAGFTPQNKPAAAILPEILGRP
jgi:hypothetical protein